MSLNSWSLEYDLLIFQLNWDLNLPRKLKQTVMQFTEDLPKTRSECSIVTFYITMQRFEIMTLLPD